MTFQKTQLPDAKFLNIKTFFDHSSKLGFTIPSKSDFLERMQKLNICQDDLVICYETSQDNENVDPLVWQARAVWTFHTHGHQHCYMMDGGLAKWINEGKETVAQ